MQCKAKHYFLPVYNQELIATITKQQEFERSPLQNVDPWYCYARGHL